VSFDPTQAGHWQWTLPFWLVVQGFQQYAEVVVSESLKTIRNWERSGGTVRIVRLSDADALVDLCACTGERMDSLISSDRELLGYLRAYAKAESGYDRLP
jgi:hypothetical protein